MLNYPSFQDNVVDRLCLNQTLRLDNVVISGSYWTNLLMLTIPHFSIIFDRLLSKSDT